MVIRASALLVKTAAEKKRLNTLHSTTTFFPHSLEPSKERGSIHKHISADGIVRKLVQLLSACTPCSHIFSVESPIRPGVLRSNHCIEHTTVTTPDVVVQDPTDGHVSMLDVTVVSPSRLLALVWGLTPDI